MPPAGFLGAGPPWPQYGQQKPKQPQYSPQPTPNPRNYQQPGQYQYASQYAPHHAVPQTVGQPQYMPQMQQHGHHQYAMQPAPNASQWSQGYAGQQNYGYQGYPQAQGYPPQNYHQQGYPQGPMVQPGYAQAPQAPAQGPSENCYNCGQPGHWAMHCLHPRAAQPAGATGQPYNPPAKRLRPNYIPPVVTKYEVPLHVQKAHQAAVRGNAQPISQPGNAASPGQHAQQAFAGAHMQGYSNGIAPPTPLSANSSGYPQICGPPPAVSPHVVAPGMVAPYTPQASPHSSTHGQSAPPPPPALPPPPPPESPISQVSSSMKPSNGQAPNVMQSRPVNPLPRKPGTQDEVPAKPSFHTGVTTVLDDISLEDKPPANKAGTEQLSDDIPDNDDLSLLDVPDLPTEDPTKYGHLPCHLISTPLQAYSANDEPNLIPEPAQNSNGTVVSRFVRPNTLNSMMENIRRSEHFPQILDDPIFRFRAEYKPPPPDVPLGPTSSHTGSWKRTHREDIQYRTISNGPAQEIPRSSTPVPEVEATSNGNAEYDPFDPAAGFPEESYTNHATPSATAYDPWSVGADSPPTWSYEGPGFQHNNHNNHNNQTHQQGRSNNSSRPDRKRNYADSFGNDGDRHRRHRNKNGNKKRGGKQSNSNGYRW